MFTIANLVWTIIVILAVVVTFILVRKNNRVRVDAALDDIGKAYEYSGAEAKVGMVIESIKRKLGKK